MIKRTLVFENSVYLSTRLSQLIIKYPDKSKRQRSVPIEDIGLIVLESHQITITNHTLAKLVENKVAIITCGSRHHPIGIFQPLAGHSEQSERFRVQCSVSIPLKKNLWKQVVEQKIRNQRTMLYHLNSDLDLMDRCVGSVLSGDSTNQEAIAAAYYWNRVFGREFGFKRDRDGEPPNNALNYGYAILRAMTARAIVSSGLHPTLGIHHHNKYNAFCLADDIMEPYRIYVDALVVDAVDKYGIGDMILSNNLKRELLKIPALDVTIRNKQRPLINALSITTNSLFECYSGKIRHLKLPKYEL